MAAATASHIAVRCKLPHGLVIRHPMNVDKTVTLKGRNKAVVIGSDYGTTMVPADFWEDWIAANADFQPVKSGAIFAGKSMADLDAIGKEFEKRATGFEPLSPTAHGVKKATADDEEK